MAQMKSKILFLLLFAFFVSMPSSAGTDVCAVPCSADTVSPRPKRLGRIRARAARVDTVRAVPVKLASHNSLTYASPLNGSPRVVDRRNRCQTLDIEGQYALGVRLFDFRVRRGDDGTATAAHGRIRYDADIEAALRFLDSRGGVVVRLMLENSLLPWRRTDDYAWFQDYAITLVARYVNISFVCGRSKVGWDKVARNLPDEPPIDQYIWRRSSTLNVIPKPARHARRENKDNFKQLNDTVWSMFDFVEWLVE